MACWTLTTFSAPTIMVAPSRTRPPATQQNARGARIKQIPPGCRGIDLPPMDAHLLLCRAGPASCNAGDPWAVSVSSRTVGFHRPNDFSTLRSQTRISRISARDLQVSPGDLTCNFGAGHDVVTKRSRATSVTGVVMAGRREGRAACRERDAAMAPEIASYCGCVVATRGGP